MQVCTEILNGDKYITSVSFKNFISHDNTFELLDF